MRSTVVLTCLICAGCPLIPRFEQTTFDDEGEACLLRASSEPVEFDYTLQADDPKEIVVFFPAGCLSSSCSEVLEASCEVAFSGNEIEVTSRGLLEQDTSPNRECTADCGIMTARCAVPDSVAAGEWTIVHGDQTTLVVVPGKPICTSP